MKKVISILITVAMLASLMVVPAFANYEAATSVVTETFDYDSFSAMLESGNGWSQVGFQALTMAVQTDEGSSDKYMHMGMESSTTKGTGRYRKTLAEQTKGVVVMEMDVRTTSKVGSHIYIPKANNDIAASLVYFQSGQIRAFTNSLGGNNISLGTYEEGKWYHITAEMDLKSGLANMSVAPKDNTSAVVTVSGYPYARTSSNLTAIDGVILQTWAIASGSEFTTGYTDFDNLTVKCDTTASIEAVQGDVNALEDFESYTGKTDLTNSGRWLFNKEHGDYPTTIGNDKDGGKAVSLNFGTTRSTDTATTTRVIYNFSDKPIYSGVINLEFDIKPAERAWTLPKLSTTASADNIDTVLSKSIQIMQFLPASLTSGDAWNFKRVQPFSEGSEFDDIDENSQFFSSVGWAQKNGIASGVGNNLFAPDESLTREAAMTFLYRAFPQLGITVDESKEDLTIAYDDFENISPWAKQSINALLNIGIVKGTDENKIEPQNTLSNAETASMLYNIYMLTSSKKQLWSRQLQRQILQMQATVQAAERK